MPIKIVFDENYSAIFGTFFCANCSIKWAPGILPKHQNCTQPQVELRLGRETIAEIKDWARKHGADEPHFSMNVSLNEIQKQLPDIL